MIVGAQILREKFHVDVARPLKEAIVSETSDPGQARWHFHKSGAQQLKKRRVRECVELLQEAAATTASGDEEADATLWRWCTPGWMEFLLSVKNVIKQWWRP